MGILRFDNALLERMSRLPNAALLLDAEFVLCPDGNYRPHSLARRETYRTIAAMIRHFAPNVPISLTMEPDYIRRSLIDPA
jgi:hypothetical protein